MQQMVDEAGNIWNVDAQGNPVSLAASANQGPPADPAFQYEGPRAAADLQNTQSTIQDRSADNRRADQQLAAQLYSKGLTIGADGNIVPIEGWVDPTKPSGDLTPEQKFSKTMQVNDIRKTIKDAIAVAKMPMTTGAASNLRYAPMATDARTLQSLIDTISGNLAFDRLQQMRNESQTGGALGQVSNIELGLLKSTVASLDQALDAEQLVANLEKIDRHYGRFNAAISGIDPDSENGKKFLETNYGGLAGPPSGPEQTDKTTSFTDPRDFGDTYQVGIAERFATENDKKFATLAQAKFDQGASFGELDSLAKQYGYQGFPGDLNDAIAYRDGTGRYQNQGPQKGARIAAPESGYNDPSIAERAFQNVAASPVGTYFGQSANALTLGTLDELQGLAAGDTLGEAFSGTGVNTAEANLKKSLQADANPTSSILGNISGGALGALATGGLTGGLRASGAFAPKALAGDAAFGGLYGAGEANQNRLSGAGMGIVAAAGGGALGRKVAPKLGDIAMGVQDPAKRLLRERGVNLLPGQIFNRTAKEDRLAGLPGSDMPINAARDSQFRQFNKAAFDEGLAPINAAVPEIAESGVESAQDAVSRSYDDALGGVVMTPDKQLEDALAGRIAQAQAIPNLGEQATYGLQKSIDEFIPADEITGKNFQNIQQNLTRRAGKFDRSPEAVGPDAAQILRQTAGDFDDLAARQAPKIVPQLQASNKAYSNVKTLQDAVSRAGNRGGNNSGVFSPAQLGSASKATAKKYGQRQGTTQQPFFELQRAGQDILPQKISDSGTAGRSAEGGIIDNAKSAMRSATNRILYSKPSIDLLNALAFERPDALIRVGNAVKKRSRLGGIFGAPTFLPTIE